MMLRSKILEVIYLILLTSLLKLLLMLNEVKGEIPSINDLATTTAVTVVKNKIPDVTNLVKKTYYNTKINETEKKITNYYY